MPAEVILVTRWRCDSNGCGSQAVEAFSPVKTAPPKGWGTDRRTGASLCPTHAQKILAQRHHQNKGDVPS